MNPTVLDFITDILVLIGALNQGQTPNPSEVAQIFFALNRRLDQYNSVSLWMYAVQNIDLQLLGGRSGPYSVGPGGIDLNVPSRPLVRHASVDIAGTTIKRPIELIGAAAYNAILEPNQPGWAPFKLYIDYQFPLSNYRVWPVQTSNCVLHLTAWVPFTGFLNLTDIIILPPGYLLPLEFTVAMDIMSSFQREINPQTLATIAQGASTASADIQQLNAQLLLGVAAGPVPEMAPVAPGTMPATPEQPQA